MADIKEDLKERLERLDSIPLELQTALEVTLKKLLNDLLTIIDKLERDKDGNIKQTLKNLAIVGNLDDKVIKAWEKSGYIEEVKSFVKEFDVQAALNDKIIKAEFIDFEPTEFAKKTLELSKKNVVDILATKPQVHINLLNPVKKFLETQVANGASWTDTISGIRDIAEGAGDNKSKLLQYAKQITNDAFSFADRTYTVIAAESLGIEFFRYSGGLIRDSRCFCKHNNNHYFHKKEIAEWGNLVGVAEECIIPKGGWAGMIPFTSPETIFVFLGGYGCRHSLSMVSEFSVPKDVIERNLLNGNYTPEKKTLELLGL